MADSSKPVVLIVEDNDRWAEAWTTAVPDTHQVVRASTVLMGFQQFDANAKRIVLVLMDGCLGGDDLNSLPLIRHIREHGYSGDIVAASGLSDYRADMVAAGCNLEQAKDEIPQLVKRLLAVK